MGFPDTPAPTPRPLAILQLFRKGKAVSGQIPEVTTKFMAHKTLQGRKNEGTAQKDKYATSVVLKVRQEELAQLRIVPSVFCAASQPLLDGWAMDDLTPILLSVSPEALGATPRCSQGAPSPDENFITS